MKQITSSFQNRFFSCLEKSSCLTKRDHQALWEIISALIGASSFSFSSLSRTLGRRIGRNYLAKLLKKYTFIQRKVINELLTDVLKNIDDRSKLYLIIDDTLVKKSGRKIFGSLRWYNHCIGRQMQALCLVTLVLECEGKCIFFMPWLLTSTTHPTKSSTKDTKQQDSKTDAAINMVQLVLEITDLHNIVRQRIIIETDSWYNSYRFRSILQDLHLDYRLDGKSNYTVQKVDHDARKKDLEWRRGRKRVHFVKYERIDLFLGASSTWAYFTDKTSRDRIFFKKAYVTLKSGGQGIIYAYRNERYQEAKFIVTNPKRKHIPDPRTIYRDYSFRWLIEVAHREIKQQFNIGRCQSRDMWVVNGFVLLIGVAFSTWKVAVFSASQQGDGLSGCPTWAKYFHEQYIKSH